MELSEYNGWENKFTWLVHLHLSSEEHLMQEISCGQTRGAVGEWGVDQLADGCP